ncbi:MAG: carboxypeptidase-like regulatory domain-containing protein [Patescibacteria group bacterium]|nr:carboxypeptidase-like regulatory domain-containing protein [Patescibacteria group bacterium]
MKVVRLFGITVTLLALMFCTCADANLRQLPAGAPAEMNGAVVMLSTYDQYYNPVIYAEYPDRTFGIAIWPEAQSFTEGDCFSAKGFVSKFPDTGEPVFVIPAAEIVTTEPGYPLSRPLGMPQRAIFQEGLSPQGSYTRLWGNVTNAASPYDSSWYMDDGTGLANDLTVDGYLTKGIKVWGYCPFGQDQQAAISGVASLYNYYGAIVPCFYPSVSQTSETRGPETFMLTGTVTADANAAGKTVQIITDAGSASATLNSSGVGTFSLQLPKGKYAVSAKLFGYKTQTKLVNFPQSTASFTLSPLSPAKLISIGSDYNILPADGTTTVEITIAVHDKEGRGYGNELLDVQLDKGQIVTPAPVRTNSSGIAKVVVRASSVHEAARLVVTSGGDKGAYNLFYAGDNDPLIWPSEPEKLTGETLSGVVPVTWYCHDMTIINGGTETIVDQLRFCTVYVDGQIVDQDIAQPETEDPTYLVFDTDIETTDLTDGPHQVWCVIEDKNGNFLKSSVLTFVSNNTINSVNTTFTNAELDGEVDLINGGTMTISANLQQSSSWKVVVKDFDPGLAEAYIGERLLAEGTGSSVSCVWDGKVYPTQADQDQPDVGVVEIQTATKTIRKWIGVRVIPDSAVKVLCVAGRPNTANWRNDPAMKLWPVATYTLYRQARDKGWPAKRLSPTQGNWDRVTAIVTNGSCQMGYTFCHGMVTANPVTGKQQTFIALPRSRNRRSTLVTSWTIPGAIDCMGIDSWGLQYSNRIRFWFNDSCHSGKVGGYLSNPAATAPQVSDSARNDFAEALGTYYDEFEEAVCLGWYTTSSGAMSWIDFVASVNSPRGIFGIWGSTTGMELRRVIGRYPPGCPLLLNQPNVPNEWWNIHQKLRSFGSSLFGGNDGYAMLQFWVY